MKTKVLKKSEVSRQWLVVDARDQILGRLCSRIARVLVGKNKPQYSPHVDSGDFVVVLNADKFRVTGRKLSDKIYYTHSMHPGGLKAVSLKSMLEKHPKRVIYKAVSGMLPKNRLRARRLKRLKIYLSSEHPHVAQTPVPVDLVRK